MNSVMPFEQPLCVKVMIVTVWIHSLNSKDLDYMYESVVMP